MTKDKMGYVSLFSSAGVGCYGFNLEGFDCIVTSELIERRLEIQKQNNVCSLKSGYIGGDINNEVVYKRITDEIENWKNKYKKNEVDVLVATPPCQGISVANHKKKNELGRNSLVVQSMRIVSETSPRYFIFENVRGFLKTLCTDVDGTDKSIEEAIMANLGGEYNIANKIINFKDYGNNSSRTRTVVIGVRKDIEELSPSELFPSKQNAPTLKQLIGGFPRIKVMGQIDEKDIYHSFRTYDERMLPWVLNTVEGQSAFDNKKLEHRPHQIVDGKIVVNQNKNGDKYARCLWDKVAPCVHTRNDILASQSTIHPEDPRVFSIRELMHFMSIPDEFKWSKYSLTELNELPLEDKKSYLKKNEINIRQCLGEAVPTSIFRGIANKICMFENRTEFSLNKVKRLIDKEKLENTELLVAYLQRYKPDFVTATKIAELANSKRLDDAAFYTRQDISFSLVQALPDFKKKKDIRILEPSVGVGNFLPNLFWKYADISRVRLDLLDINEASIVVLKQILKSIKIPPNFEIRFINADFLTHNFRQNYDVVVGNPPFGKIDTGNYNDYLKNGFETKLKTRNIFALFYEKALSISSCVAFISPKSVLNAPEYSGLRELLSKKAIIRINDYGEKGFRGVKIETVSIVVDNNALPNVVAINSSIMKTFKVLPQEYIASKDYPYWLIYRDNYFDNLADNLRLGTFDVLRDRALTSKSMMTKGKFMVVRARNISNGSIIKTDNDLYVDDPKVSSISKLYFGKDNILIAPNLSYYPRVALLPANSIVDGSSAILVPKSKYSIDNSDLAFFSSREFFMFYRIARNYSTRSLNIDSYSAYFWAPPKRKIKYKMMEEHNRARYLFALPTNFLGDFA